LRHFPAKFVTPPNINNIKPLNIKPKQNLCKKVKTWWFCLRLSHEIIKDFCWHRICRIKGKIKKRERRKKMKIIRLWIKDNQWMAEFEGPEKDEIIGLMGTNLIPTAYLAGTARETVCAEVSRLNPGYQII